MDFLKRASYATCTKETCPASYSIYGYAPNLGANAFFVALFAVSCLTFCYQAHLYRKWIGFSVAMILGTALESVGYGSRLMLSRDPFSAVGFKLNIVLLTFAPAFLTAGIYLLLKSLCYTLNPKLSPLRPSLYTPIFVSCDIVAILLQGAGGAISAAANHNKKVLNLGVNIMIAGLSSQVATLAIFGVLAGIFFARVVRKQGELMPPAEHLWFATRFRLFLGAATLAFVLIFIRCAYRIAELKNGWGSKIMRDEDEFIGLDSVMVSVAAILLNIFHPGHCFNQMADSATDISLSDVKNEDEIDAMTVRSSMKAHDV